jgi:hypothetical protein
MTVIYIDYSLQMSEHSEAEHSPSGSRAILNLTWGGA